VAKVVAAIAPGSEDVFIEIGPGRGALTRPLALAARHVLAFEIDRDLATALHAAHIPGLTAAAADFLDVAPGDLRTYVSRVAPPGSPLRVAGNLPYNVGSPILFKLLALYREGILMTDATVMLQREVADRLVAPPGSRDYGVLSVLIRHEADVSRLLSLPPGAFRPMPRVDSTVVRLRFHAPEPPARNPESFARMTRAVFSRRRKTLANALLAFPPAAAEPQAALEMAGIDGKRRPETLDIPELVGLADAIDRLQH
jgi:16S rRNA (adenine1518-N6/adenine1519-N6)-dimethyltransferase